MPLRPNVEFVFGGSFVEIPNASRDPGIFQTQIPEILKQSPRAIGRNLKRVVLRVSGEELLADQPVFRLDLRAKVPQPDPLFDR